MGLTEHLEGLRESSPAFLPKDQDTLEKLIVRSRQELTYAQQFDMPRLLGPLANVGYDPVNRPELPDDHRVHKATVERWGFLGVVYDTEAVSTPICLIVTKRYPYPGGEPLLRVCTHGNTATRSLSERDTYVQYVPFDLGVGTYRMSSEYPSVLFPMNVEMADMQLRATMVKPAVTYESGKFGVGTSGYVYPNLRMEATRRGVLMAGEGCFFHEWSYGVADPTFPPAFLQRAMNAAFVSDLSLGAKKHMIVNMDNLQMFMDIPDGREDFEALVPVTISHHDGDTDRTELTLGREGSTMRIQYEPLDLDVNFKYNPVEIGPHGYMFSSSELQGHDGVVQIVSSELTQEDLIESISSSLGVTEAKIVGPSGSQGAAAMAFWIIPIGLFIGIIVFVVILIQKTGVF